MAENVRGPFNVAKAVFAEMKRTSAARPSMLRLRPSSLGRPGMLHYVTSKGAVVAFTRSLAQEVAPYAISINGIAPGLT